MEYIYIMLGSLGGALGYALMVKSSLRSLVPIAIFTTLGMIVYCVCDCWGFSEFSENMAAAFVMASLSEIGARIWRMPAVVIMLPSMVPLVPGSMLYYAVSNMIAKNYSVALDYAERTLIVASGIAGGMIVSMVLFATINTFVIYLVKKIRKKTAN